jgi:predicted TIM-barrel fold metal-dependent hydrolase
MLKTVTHQELKDSAGNLIPTVICEHISEQAKEQISEQKFDDESRMLRFIKEDPRASIANLAPTIERWRR